MTAKEAALRLGISLSTVYELCASGRLPHRRIGLRKGSGKITITEAHLAAFLESCEVGPREEPARGGGKRKRSSSGRPDGKPLQHFD